VDEVAVRLTVHRDAALVDKRLLARGQGADGRPAPFERLPLVYENALGGIGFEDNPFGSGIGGTAGPKLIDPADATKVACFAPLSRGWPARKRLLGAADRRALDQPVLEIPNGFDWSYFQAAPPDQRTEHLAGDEWVVLQGMHRAQPRARSHLPWVKGVARVHGLPDAPDGRDLRLVCDTLRIDADSLRCSVVWRTSLPLADEAVLGRLTVVGALELRGQPPEWPAAPPPPLPRAAPVVGLLSTMAIDPDDPEPSVAPAMPFRPLVPSMSLLSREPFEVAEPMHSGTVATEDQEDEAPLPFRSSTPPPPVPAAPAVRVPPPPPVARRPPPPPQRQPPSPHAVEAPAQPAPRARGLELINDTGLAFGVAPWGRDLARDCLTVVARATCDLVPGGRATLRRQSAPLEADTALYKVRADVVALGHAYAPPGGARSMEVRFAFGASHNAFDRRLLVFGERTWARAALGEKPTEPEPFQRMPLVWERAFGGPKVDENPVGVGAPDPMHIGPRRLPNVEDVARRLRTPKQQARPASFAPLPLAWKDRIAARGRAREAWPLLPEERIDWTRFQAAPPEQQLALLKGDEPYALHNMHPEHAVLEGTLPGKRARCFALLGERLRAVPLELDTVVFTVDELRVDLMFRGILPVADESAATGALHLVLEEVGDPTMTLEEARDMLVRR
jgi:hypothetical protein